MPNLGSAPAGGVGNKYEPTSQSTTHTVRFTPDTWPCTIINGNINLPAAADTGRTYDPVFVGLVKVDSVSAHIVNVRADGGATSSTIGAYSSFTGNEWDRQGLSEGPKDVVKTWDFSDRSIDDRIPYEYVGLGGNTGTEFYGGGWEADWLEVTYTPLHQVRL